LTTTTISFTSLNLAPPIQKAVVAKGYTIPTPIQAQAIPPIIAGRDLLGIAQTGTGKTAAFALPILHRLHLERRPAPKKGCRALVLSPTRELASQIAESFKTYGRHMGVSVAVVFGGVSHGPQRIALMRGVDVLIATPGRLIDHMMERTADLSTTEIFVLDEADQMLDLGFLKPIRTVVARLPKDRLNLFFSATMPEDIGKLAAELLTDPVRVSVTPVAKTADRVAQRVIHLPTEAKRDALAQLLSDEAVERCIVFTRTKRGADRVAENLEAAGIPAAAIHGNKSQGQRERALGAFRKGQTRILVATDIAARGIDVSGVSHVVNYELPEVPEAYVHRIGRTARAGAEGQAISLCAPDERGDLRAIERLIKQQIPAESRGVDLDAPIQPRLSRQQNRQRQQQRGGQGQAHNRQGQGHGQGQPRDPREQRPRPEVPRHPYVHQPAASRDAQPARREEPRAAHHQTQGARAGSSHNLQRQPRQRSAPQGQRSGGQKRGGGFGGQPGSGRGKEGGR
jgi:ATP-dependent RNA helicase RhlE